LWTYPQHNANYGDPEVPTSRKPTTQQLKTVVLWVFWTLALVGHRIYTLTIPRFGTEFIKQMGRVMKGEARE